MTDGQAGFGAYPAPIGTVPALSKVPAGEMISSTRHEPKHRVAEVLHSDTSWRRVTVLAWAARRKGWAVLIRWPDGREDWREYDRRHIRPGLSLCSAVVARGGLVTARLMAGVVSVAAVPGARRLRAAAPLVSVSGF
jgi:hypothetical protein